MDRIRSGVIFHAGAGSELRLIRVVTTLTAVAPIRRDRPTLTFIREYSMNSNAKSIRVFLPGVLAMAMLVLSGCAQDAATRSTTSGGTSSGSSASGSSASGIGGLTGGAEARPTSDPGVTPGKKP
jgi:hypothetical protein